MGSSETCASGPPPGGQIAPFPSELRALSGMTYVQSLTREIGPVISQTGACPPPPPAPSHGPHAAGLWLGTLLCLVAAGRSLDF